MEILQQITDGSLDDIDFNNISTEFVPLDIKEELEENNLHWQDNIIIDDIKNEASEIKHHVEGWNEKEATKDPDWNFENEILSKKLRGRPTKNKRKKKSKVW